MKEYSTESFELDIDDLFYYIYYTNPISLRKIKIQLNKSIKSIYERMNAKDFESACERWAHLINVCPSLSELVPEMDDWLADYVAELEDMLDAIVEGAIASNNQSLKVAMKLMKQLHVAGQNYESYILHSVAEMAHHPEVLSFIVEFINEVSPKLSSFDQQQLYALALEVISKHDESLLPSFLEQHQDHKEVIAFQLNRLLEKGEFQEARLILERVIEKHPSFTPKLAGVYEDLGEYDKATTIYVELFKDGYFFTVEDFKCICKKRFTQIYEALKRAYYEDDSYNSVLYLEVVEHEKDFEELLRFVTKKRYLIERYASKLFSIYPDEVVEIYRASILGQAEISKTRSDYKYLCDELRKFKEFASNEQMSEIIYHLIRKYPRRKVMIELLQQVDG